MNEHGSPTRAMWTDLGFNLVLLMMSDYMTVLSISNVCYMLFVFLNLQSGWIHRMDRGNWDRLFRCPVAARRRRSAGMRTGMSVGRQPAGEGTLRNGLIAMLLIVPVFLFRHYWQDRGRFPAQMQRDMELEVPKRAMWLNLMPYVALVGAG